MTMQIYENELYRQDLQTVLAGNDFSALAGKSILITGAAGLIGSALVDLLMELNRTKEAGIKIYAAVHSLERAKGRFDTTSDMLELVAYDALEPVCFKEKADLIIHAASKASPDAYVNDPVGTMNANYLGLFNLLQYATTCKAEKLLFVSSSEVYGRKDTLDPFREDDYGFVDLLSVRSSYPSGKRAAETLCVGYGKQYDLPVSIVRPGHIYGPTATKKDQRVSSAFAYQAARGEDLVMKSLGTQIRSYCHCLDCASAILYVLINGAAGEAYNISNSDSIITIREMAAMYAEAAGVELKMEVASTQEQTQFNPMDNSSLNSEKLEALGWKGRFPAKEGLGHTVQILRELEA